MTAQRQRTARRIRLARLQTGIFVAVLFALGVTFVQFSTNARNRTEHALHGFANRLKGHRAPWPARPRFTLFGAKDTPDEADLRSWELSRATQFAGTGSRVQRFLEKAARGEPFTVAAIGGSVSKGRGLTPPAKIPTVDGEQVIGAETLYSPENLHMLVFSWLNSTFPNKGQNRFINGAQGGVGAGYFAWCFKEHIDEDVDLVLVELGINDLNEMKVIRKYERLIRSLLELDSAPAVINIETFTTLFPSLLSSSALHNDVVAYYDVPSFSLRDILMPRIMVNPAEQLPRWFRTGGDVALGDDKVREWGGVPVDLMHISAKGHALAAGLVIDYLNEQLSALFPRGVWRKLVIGRLRAAAQRVYELPSTSLTLAFNPDDLPAKRAPVCRSQNSAKSHNRISGTDDAGGYGQTDDERLRGLVLDSSSKGWEQWQWDEKHYLVAKEPGALAVFDFVIAEPTKAAATASESLADPMDVYEPETETASPEESWAVEHTSRKRSVARALEPAVKDGGTVAIGYQRSAHFGFGSVWCWVDNDRAGGKRLDGYWTIKERNMGIVDEVATALLPGKHRLQCELLKETLDPQGRTEFRLFAIVHN